MFWKDKQANKQERHHALHDTCKIHKTKIDLKNNWWLNSMNKYATPLKIQSFFWDPSFLFNSVEDWCWNASAECLFMNTNDMSMNTSDMSFQRSTVIASIGTNLFLWPLFCKNNCLPPVMKQYCGHIYATSESKLHKVILSTPKVSVAHVMWRNIRESTSSWLVVSSAGARRLLWLLFWCHETLQIDKVHSPACVSSHFTIQSSIRKFSIFALFFIFDIIFSCCFGISYGFKIYCFCTLSMKALSSDLIDSWLEKLSTTSAMYFHFIPRILLNSWSESSPNVLEEAGPVHLKEHHQVYHCKCCFRWFRKVSSYMISL